mgnify:CR=1 FL=1
MKHIKIDFNKLLKGYAKGWIAVSSDYKRVLNHGKTLEEVMKKVSNKSNDKEKVYYFPSGEKYSNFIGWKI